MQNSFEQTVKRKLNDNEIEELVKAIEEKNNEIAKVFFKTMDDLDEEIEFSFVSATVLYFCCEYNNEELVKYLISENVNLNKTSSENTTPLMKASHNQNIEIVQCLINAGVNLNFIDEEGFSALSQTVYNKNTKIFELLISSGIDISICGGTTLINSCRNNHVIMIKRLIELGANVNHNDKFQNTPLHRVCTNSNLNMVKLLLENGADENIKNYNGKTPADFAISEEIKEFIKNYNRSEFVLK